MKHLFYGIASWLLAPVAIVSGLRVRAGTPRLSPPQGRPFGVAGQADIAPLRLLVVGDSSAAGVGVDDVSETVGAQLAAILYERTGKSVSWRNAGANSAVCAEIRDHVVPNLERIDYTHIIIAAGTNDAKNFVTAKKFKRGFGGLLYALRAKWPEAVILWSPVIDMRMVPSLPPLLAHILHMRASIINRMGRQLCKERFAMAAAQLYPHDPAGFSEDGFHAGAAGYRYWAELLADTILEDAGEPATTKTEHAEAAQ
ncbi:SGNH/GDSL hydrolase family protein [Hoeflea prorocentri]|uniref:SGNH/GDSL hydrolase family protein n=1 Tax=Hoeflea prorocentri TaxID=1922333 RepID=A0A9X3UD98_9HYPH|nr:SGNH/GDSL hydrolase family protein [Hoeflea prorocentri]MCY6379292.1 SGNH/GDSL hydrolase family protein [Hoeflea prorocentri]MDA5397093.1 SGNH/GDSL hydrolase family protein [Hoeflea prorocentri]